MLTFLIGAIEYAMILLHFRKLKLFHLNVWVCIIIIDPYILYYLTILQFYYLKNNIPK